MSTIKNFSIGCFVASILLAAGYFFGQADPISSGSIPILLLSAIVVAIANVAKGRIGTAVARGCVFYFFTYVFFELAHKLSLSSFDPTPTYGVALLVFAVARATASYLFSVPTVHSDLRRDPV